MPTYDYSCRKCGHAYEVFEAISASTRKACPKCGRRTAHRMIGAGAGLLFKGSGFYITDYKNAGARPAAEAPPSKSKTAAEAAPAKSESCAGGKAPKDCACAPEKPKKGKSA
ncbi:MAG: FmdB family zinc ribbon protein [Planctomycetota bacterium]